MRNVLIPVLAGVLSFVTGILQLQEASALAATAAAGKTLRIGLSLQPSNALVMVALDRDYFAGEGLTVSVRRYVSGTRALHNGLLAGKVDLTTASDVPVVLNRFERQDFSIIATIFQVDNQNRIIARADQGIKRPAELKGRRIATQRGSAVHFFLHLFLLENGIPEDAVKLSFMKAVDLPHSLERGDIDAFSMREPYIGQARKLLGNRAVVFASPGLYSQTDQLVVMNDFLDANPASSESILRALVRAERFVSANPRKSQEIVGRFLGTSAVDVEASWPEFVPRLSLEQSLLLRLEDIGRWAVRQQIVRNRPIPNFLKLFHFEALQAVKPVAITVVR